VSYAIKYLSTIEEDIKKVNNFKLENFFAFENKLSIFQKILFESLSQQNMIHPEVFKAEVANGFKEQNSPEFNHKQDELKELISHLFTKKNDLEINDDHTTVDMKKLEEKTMMTEESHEKTQSKTSFKRRKNNRKDMAEFEEFDHVTKKKKLNLAIN